MFFSKGFSEDKLPKFIHAILAIYIGIIEVMIFKAMILKAMIMAFWVNIHKSPFSSTTVAALPFDLVHIALWGLYRVLYNGKYKKHSRLLKQKVFERYEIVQ